MSLTLRKIICGIHFAALLRIKHTIITMRKLYLMVSLAIALSMGQLLWAQPSLTSAFVSYSKTDNKPSVLAVANEHFGTLEWRNASRINTHNREISPVFLQDDIVFVSTRKLPSSQRLKTKERGDNFFNAEIQKNGKLKTRHPLLGQINKFKKNGPVSFSPSGKSIFFARKDISASGKTIYKLSYAQKSGKSWKKVKDLPLNDMLSNSIHPYISPDASCLYFASDRLGGFGGMDIYVSYYKKGYWTVPINLGPGINSAKDEMYPVLGTDGKLYFASDREGGQGGLDIYQVGQMDDADVTKWQGVSNLGDPFNSAFDDFGFLLDKNHQGGYFTSNRPGGEGQEDIYQWKINNKLVVAPVEKKQKLVNIKPEKPVPPAQPLQRVEKADSELANTKALKNEESEKEIVSENKTYKTGQRIILSNIISDIQSLDDFAKAELDFVSEMLKQNPSMSIDIQYPKGFQNAGNRHSLSNYLYDKGINHTRLTHVKNSSESENVVVEISSMNYALIHSSSTSSNPLSIKDVPAESSSEKHSFENRENALEEPYVQAYEHILEEKISMGINAKLTKLHYDFNEFLLDGEAEAELDRVVNLMQRFPSMKVSLQSHTDAAGSKAYNEKLSARRSIAAKDYLLRKGIAVDRIQVEYFGEDRLIYHCDNSSSCSKEVQRINRRTEVRITHIDQNEIAYINN